MKATFLLREVALCHSPPCLLPSPRCPDPRRARDQRYSMRHLLLFSVLATLAGAASYQGIIALQREPGSC